MSLESAVFYLNRSTTADMIETTRNDFISCLAAIVDGDADPALIRASHALATANLELRTASNSETVVHTVSGMEAEEVFQDGWAEAYGRSLGIDAQRASESFTLILEWEGTYPRDLLRQAGGIIGGQDAAKTAAAYKAMAAEDAHRTQTLGM